MNGGLTSDATLGRTARAALEHLRRQSGYPTWLLTRINDYERIVVAAVDPEFSIVANSVLPNDLSTDRFLGNVSKMVVPVDLPNGRQYGALIGSAAIFPRRFRHTPNRWSRCLQTCSVRWPEPRPPSPPASAAPSATTRRATP
jgi:hypothetical protein